MTSQAAGEGFFRKFSTEIDYLHIDGDHSYEGVKSDFALFSPRMSAKGVITIHDARLGGVNRFLDELERDQAWRVVRFADIGQGLALVRRAPGPVLPAVVSGAYMAEEDGLSVQKQADDQEDGAAMWSYLETESLKTRYAVAAFLLEGCATIVEVGGYKTPLSGFIPALDTQIVVIDPLVDETPDTSDGRVRHLAYDFDDYDYSEWADTEYSVAFLGFRYV